MQETFNYRGYAVTKHGLNFIARSHDDHDFALVSRDVERINLAIDQLWESLEGNGWPGWLRHLTIDLDDPEVAHYFEPMKITEPPMRHLKPIFYSVTGLILTTAVACGLHIFCPKVEPEVLFTMVVASVALVWGELPGVIVTLAAAVCYNFALVPPLNQISVPTRAELIYLTINVGVSFLIPWLIRAASAYRVRLRTPSTLSSCRVCRSLQGSRSHIQAARTSASSHYEMGRQQHHKACRPCFF